jgi:hypothetical protein
MTMAEQNGINDQPTASPTSSVMKAAAAYWQSQADAHRISLEQDQPTSDAPMLAATDRQTVATWDLIRSKARTLLELKEKLTILEELASSELDAGPLLDGSVAHLIVSIRRDLASIETERWSEGKESRYP